MDFKQACGTGAVVVASACAASDLGALPGQDITLDPVMRPITTPRN